MTPSDDLFSEVFEERAAIHEHEGGLDRETAERMATASTEAYRHSCEVRDIVKKHRKYAALFGEADADSAMDDFLAKVAKHRGQSAADRLRADALGALKNNTQNS